LWLHKNEDMNSSEFWYGVGNFFTDTFGILRAGGNFVNWIFIVIIFVTLLAWLSMQAKYNSAEMKEDGKLK